MSGIELIVYTRHSREDPTDTAPQEEQQIGGLEALRTCPIRTKIAFYEALSELEPRVYKRLAREYRTGMILRLGYETLEESMVKKKVAEKLGVEPREFRRLPGFNKILWEILTGNEPSLLLLPPQAQRYEC